MMNRLLIEIININQMILISFQKINTIQIIFHQI